jgi:ribonucleoside-diphosphate reductase alpha chain
MKQEKEWGPVSRVSKEIHALKYRSKGESFKAAQTRFASALADDNEHFYTLREILLNQRFMGAGRTQQAVGSMTDTTAFNCFVSGKIPDSFDGIMDIAKESGQTMRKGGGIGYDFSTLRPRGALICSLGSPSSGPVTFMGIFDAICKTVSSAGHRRGAQMGVLRVDHPDIEEFILAKQNATDLTAFNISIGITDKFMRCVRKDKPLDLVFEGVVYKTIRAKMLWETIMRSTWDWAEPGILFIDRINEMNNLYYCEKIAATNPCGEQPLPPYGACLLGSFNLVKYLKRGIDDDLFFDSALLKSDVLPVVRAMDNIIDNTTYPLPEQEAEAKSKRRMGLGVTGLANCVELLGYPYGSPLFLEITDHILGTLRNNIYAASVELAKEKGAFPLFNHDYCYGEYIKTLPRQLRDDIYTYGIRNSHLVSIAPTGTISLTADNVSGGIEPLFSHSYDRTIQTVDGPVIEEVKDYAYNVYGFKGKTANECTAKEHLDVLALATKYVDSAVSKTINVSPDMAWEEFKDIYMQAWEMGCKGCTTFNSGGKRFGVLVEKIETEAMACYIDEQTGQKECS